MASRTPRFAVQEVVWAKVGHCPWWPGKIVAIQTDRTPIRYRVFFFENDSEASVTEKRIERFDKGVSSHSRTYRNIARSQTQVINNRGRRRVQKRKQAGAEKESPEKELVVESTREKERDFFEILKQRISVYVVEKRSRGTNIKVDQRLPTIPEAPQIRAELKQETPSFHNPQVKSEQPVNIGIEKPTLIYENVRSATIKQILDILKRYYLVNEFAFLWSSELECMIQFKDNTCGVIYQQYVSKTIEVLKKSEYSTEAIKAMIVDGSILTI